MAAAPDARIASLHRALGIPEAYGTLRGLPFHKEASSLVVIGQNFDGRDVSLTPAAAKAWRRMHASAASLGVVLQPISGFRAVDRQAEIIQAKLAAGQTLDAILQVTAAPGYSEHHSGRAIDLGTPADPPLRESFAETAAFRWLESNAKNFGFGLSYPRGNPFGIAYEPWHWLWAQKTASRN
jgi:D-alanyl-D-alanine carboxypeptidase